MDLKVVLVIVCLSALAITSTEAGIPKCCLGIKDKVHPKLFHKVERWYLQKASGACDIDALLVFLKGKKKPMCIGPKWSTLIVNMVRRHQIEKMKRN